MTIQRFYSRTTPTHRGIATSVLLLALGLASSPLWAAEHGEPTPLEASAQTTQARTLATIDASNDASSSRINGRADWDVDYPSQLAPQAIHPVQPASGMTQRHAATSGQL